MGTRFQHSPGPCLTARVAEGDSTFSRRRFLAAAAASAGGAHTTIAAEWPLRLSTSSILFWQFGIREACRRIARLGFQAVDIWSAFAHCTHLEEAKANLGPAGTKKMLADSALGLCAITVYWSGYAPFAEMLGQMGGGVVVRNSEATEKPSAGVTANIKVFLESLKPEIELAEKYNGKIAVENHSGPTRLLNRLDSFKAFVDLNRSRHVGIALAPYHVQRNQESVEDVVRTCGNQLLYFYAWQLGKGLDQLPGHGPVDCTPWLEALRAANYRGFLNVFMHGEIEPADMEAALKKSMEYLKQCHARMASANRV
jgi:sugar phosphate isomerase/epimerase